MPDIERHSTARWNGTLREGNGTVTSGSGALKDTSYAFVSRFESGNGTNPEELLAAAHAACFSMALAARLARGNFNVHHVETEAVCHLSPQQPTGWKISKITLKTKGKVEGIDAEKFAAEAEETKKTCIVSQALSAVPMELETTLE
jgi:osmotically inducible protein OsmC